MHRYIPQIEYYFHCLLDFHKHLLKTVVDFKMKFYPRAWAKYPEAIPGTLKLIPPKYRFPALINDYEAMKDML